MRDKLHKVIRGSYDESQAWWRLPASYPQSGPRALGDLIAVSRARAANLVKRHNKDWGYLRNIDAMVSEIVRCIVDIDANDQVGAFAKACGALQSYVCEDEQILRSLERMANDDPQAFPSRYMDHEGVACSREVGLGKWEAEGGVENGRYQSWMVALTLCWG